ncbi:DUF1294 domain-containing protein [Bacillus massiliglaciei]|uniref:DUF1294 domain-containing protein n=1 Tax=Bacillus massiliglaciei TaxID=1816693 RepID=UPI000DA620A8|nr:DUF1294 domain-containing protein [Bacillus massiliglaciei]
MKFILLYAVIMNAAAFAAMGIDKKRARNGQYRISEKTLWTLAVLGGAIGGYAGMKQFRHKTKHVSFKWGFPALAIIEAALLAFCFFPSV